MVRQAHPGWRRAAIAPGFILLLGMVLALTAACTTPPAHATPRDALTAWPGLLTPRAHIDPSSVEILAHEEVEGRLTLLYRWRTPGMETPGTFFLGVTVVAREGPGWRAQASFRGDTGAAVIEADQDLIAHYAPGQTVAAWGRSAHGAQVRVFWSDGVVATEPVEHHAFLQVRANPYDPTRPPFALSVQRIEVLDGGGAVLEEKRFPDPRPPAP